MYSRCHPASRQVPCNSKESEKFPALSRRPRVAAYSGMTRIPFPCALGDPSGTRSSSASQQRGLSTGESSSIFSLHQFMKKYHKNVMLSRHSPTRAVGHIVDANYFVGAFCISQSYSSSLVYFYFTIIVQIWKTIFYGLAFLAKSDILKLTDERMLICYRKRGWCFYHE